MLVLCIYVEISCSTVSSIFLPLDCVLAQTFKVYVVFCTLDLQRHPLRQYLEYVGHLYQKLDPLPDQERFEVFILIYVCNIGMV